MKAQVNMGFVKSHSWAFLIGTMFVAASVVLACPSSATAAPKVLTSGGDLDPILKKSCAAPGGLKKEVLDKTVADASGFPVGEIGTFDCKLSKGGVATWMMHLGDDQNTGSIYKITVYGAQRKQLLKNGVIFAKRVLSPAGQKALDAAVSGYTKKPSDDGAARWGLMELASVKVRAWPFHRPWCGLPARLRLVSSGPTSLGWLKRIWSPQEHRVESRCQLGGGLAVERQSVRQTNDEGLSTARTE